MRTRCQTNSEELPIGGRRLCAAVREFYALERMAEQDEIMGLALFLASRYLTGAQIVIDGGGLRLAD